MTRLHTDQRGLLSLIPGFDVGLAVVLECLALLAILHKLGERGALRLARADGRAGERGLHEVHQGYA